jgi:hypothetical protein
MPRLVAFANEETYRVAGQEGDDAQPYQEKQLRQARAALEKARKRKP